MEVIETMKQKTEFAYPTGLQIGEQPKSDKRILAASLLSTKQVETARSDGSAVVFQHGESVFTARPQDQIPAESRLVLQEDTGELYGVSPVTGG